MNAWWWFTGIVAYVVIGGVAWALCAAAGRADDEMGVPRG